MASGRLFIILFWHRWKTGSVLSATFLRNCLTVDCIRCGRIGLRDVLRASVVLIWSWSSLCAEGFCPNKNYMNNWTIYGRNAYISNPRDSRCVRILRSYDDVSAISSNQEQGQVITSHSVGVPAFHYNDVIMGTITSQITSFTIVYSTVYPGAGQSKHQSSASLAFVRGIHRSPVNSPHKWPVTRKMLPFDDVIMETVRIFSGIYCLIQW